MLQGAALLGASALALGGYAVAEPFRQQVTRYRPTPDRWPQGQRLRLALIADLHAVAPWMDEARIDGIVAETNALGADVILLLGDYVAGYRISRFGEPLPAIVWAAALSRLSAPLGVHAVLGNHDWWEDRELQRTRKGRPPAAAALEAAGIPVYENRAVRLVKGGRAFWLAGLGDQWAFWPRPENYARFVAGGKRDYDGVHDLGATLAQVVDDAPVILMAHEPDIFDEVPARVALTVAGHTHGGQVRLAGFSPIVPSRFGRRFAYGHIVEEGRHMVVSGGLGLSGFPVRLGVAPEIVVVDLG
jgi:hypothetical protein